MKINAVQAILASIAILVTAVLAQVLTPRELMASASASLELEKAIPKALGNGAISNIWELAHVQDA